MEFLIIFAINQIKIKTMKKTFLVILSLAFVSFSFIYLKNTEDFSGALNGNVNLKNDAITSKETISVRNQEVRDTITIIGVGDMMLGTNYPSAAYLPPNDGKDLLKPVEEILCDADLTFGNLEGCLLTKGGHVKSCKDPSKCYAFRMPEHYVKHLKKACFDVVSLANNHMGDFGQPGRDKTIEMLKAEGINFAGLIKFPSTTFEKDGITYGFCAFSPNRGTVKIHDIANARKIVAALDTLADIVIVSFHGGAEGSRYRHVTRKTEVFYGENRGNVYDFSHQMIDAGADVIFGHGPHITRAVEVYKDRFIAYSLGNFCTYARFNLRGHNGVAPIVKLFVDRDGKFLKAKVFSIKQPGEGGPVKDPAGQAYKEIIELSKADFPESPVTYKEDGWIYPKK